MFGYFYWRTFYVLLVNRVNESTNYCLILLDMSIKNNWTKKKKLNKTTTKYIDDKKKKQTAKKKKHRAKITHQVFWRKSSDYAPLANPSVDLSLIDRIITVGTVAECHANDIWNLRRTSNTCHHFAYDWSP